MNAKRQITFVEEGGVKIGKLEFAKGDTFTFLKAEADQYIEAGWAKCTKTGKTGKRVEGHKVMKVDDTFVAMQ